MLVLGTGVEPSTSSVEKSVCVLSSLCGPRSRDGGEEYRETGELERERDWDGEAQAGERLGWWTEWQWMLGVRMERAISWMLGRVARRVMDRRGGIALIVRFMKRDGEL